MVWEKFVIFIMVQVRRQIWIKQWDQNIYFFTFLDRGFHFNVARYSLDWIKQASLSAGLTNTR
jgi:hypothetical protein